MSISSPFYWSLSDRDGDMFETELGHRATEALDVENSDWPYKFYWMSPAWWWDADSATWVKETRPEMLEWGNK
jgi:hypothetical protein